MRRFGTALLIGVIALSACSDDPPDFEVADPIGNAEPGDVIALRANGGAVEYVSRRTGEIRSFDTATDATQILATIGVSTDGEQRGLLGHTVIDDRRFAAWTDPDTFDLVVGEVTSGSVDRMIWSGTGTQSKAVGGHLDTIDGKILLGIGSLTDWANDHGSGAMVTLDPDGNEGQSPVVLSDGWNNPFAFTVLDDGTIWVADNAPDGSDLPVAERDGERIATTDATGPSLLEPPPQRAPSAIVELPDGRLGVCGFLDNEMRSYSLTDDGNLERAGTIGPCLTGAAVLADGTIVTASTNDDGDAALLIRTP
ncbi:MAG: hypothetical protein HOJ85_05505 [Ilumatobacter sp.]|uniref:hypothetical protein n=1 Tax=Ilumatobacter sp. TaxID=1967498 RepID=UPI001DA8542A|nr:hypothetical protein [Ilumatobacter sp.]MBT5275838.1 hypothetical protein [Ilumatobacter sp.]MBT5553200.1 hypothetical protein [Ilumatobacter sp.]MBT5864954.1 hypothetical protein [Ilumatobacter sp.]MBT7429061.1 hypothetical protein [Ilumatobacter sp.]